MENTAENRMLVARLCVESMTPEEMEEALMYEMRSRYKRETGLFDYTVQQLKDMNMIENEGGM